MNKMGPGFRVTCLTASLLLGGPALAALETSYEQNDIDIDDNTIQRALRDNLEDDIDYSQPFTSKSLIPKLDSSNINWWDGKNHLTESLVITFQNIDEYYQEAFQRYGDLPPKSDLAKAKMSYARFLAINGYSKAHRLLAKNIPAKNSFGSSATATPEIPLINREVSAINGTTFTKPLLPPMRFSRDGRIGMVGSVAGFDGKPNSLLLQINRPEQLTQNFLDSKASVPSMSNKVWSEADYKKWGMPGAQTVHSVMLCEPKPEIPSHGNPYACGVNGEDDCYNFTLIGDGVKYSYVTSKALQIPDGEVQTQIFPQLEEEDRLYSREMTVRVTNPKTANAEIAAVDFNSDYKIGPTRTGLFFEPTLPLDGRLLVARRTGLPLVWRHTVSGEMRVGAYENVYAVAPESAKPCDISEWGEFYPLSHAHFDPRMKRYDFTKYQFRDPMGNYIADGEEMKGTYPWVSMDAKVMTMQMSDADIFNGDVQNGSHRYKNEFVFPGFELPENYNYIDKSNVNQTMVMGAWTKGKMVLFDNSLNFADYKIPFLLSIRLKDIYQPGTALPVTENKSVDVDIIGSREQAFGGRFDSYLKLLGEDGEPMIDENGNLRTRLLKNSQFFESIENRLVYNPFMLPGIPSDVPWLASNGLNSLALNFDDILNNNAFILSDMVAAYTWKNKDPHRFTGFDGWNIKSGDWRGQVKVQNAATALPEQWVVPDSGEVIHGRIEPVANGGIKGKGMYFNGLNTRISYKISPDQPKPMSEAYWFHSLFLDARGLSTELDRVVLDFPDKSRLTMTDAGSNVNLKAYNKYGELKQVIPVPADLVKERWLHLGLQRAPDNQITVYINGFAYTEFKSDGLMFQMKGGNLALGHQHNAYATRYSSFKDFLNRKPSATPAVYSAFKGWMDEYKVFAYEPEPETICNFAHGTLVGVGSNTEMIEQATRYPAQMHARISDILVQSGKPNHSQYACYLGNATKDNTAKMHSLPPGSVGIRKQLHFPEGPLYHDAPRPDSSNNRFCLVCHSGHNNEKIKGLTVNALRFKDVPAKLDPRRQPSQPRPWITGNIPPEFVESIGGNKGAIGSNYIDEYMMPSKTGTQ